MSNEKLAREVLSAILEKDVLYVQLSQQEVVIADEERMFTMSRLDFKARIRDENGREEMVLIELQKSKLPTNLLRFRTYLGMSYSNRHSQSEDTRETLLPIITIYILSYNIEDIPVMAAKVGRRVTDMSSREELPIKSDFIELLTQDCYVLQGHRLLPRRRTRIEQFMTLFNQAWIKERNLILDLEEVSDEFKDVAEYLQRPLLEEETRMKLLSEEELESVFALQEAERAELLDELSKAKAREREALLKVARGMKAAGGSLEEI